VGVDREGGEVFLGQRTLVKPQMEHNSAQGSAETKTQGSVSKR